MSEATEIKFIQYAWKRVLPFTLALAAGVGLAIFVDFGEPPTTNGPDVKSAAPRTDAALSAWVPTRPPTVHRELPSIHVLSPMLMSEVQVMELLGEYEGARILSPPGVAYVPAARKDYRQGVLQVNFLFGTDGVIYDVVPVEKRVMCGSCLEGDRWVHSEKVVRLDERDPRHGEFVEAAAAALKRIEFTPARVAGRPYPTHGFAECVFRLD